ncbi:MAG: hypothetical protein EOP22_10460 [Hyphomicrobiales bacterium]|nr:MAG: hypothetical protein EOP22_10460 [Hyphomicrobiales bacterium]
MFRPIAISALLAFVPTVALAADFQLTVKNGYTDAVSGISVSGGKVHDFKRVPANGTRTFTITLADDKCVTKVLMTYANGQSQDGDFDFCQYDMITLGWVE